MNANNEITVIADNGGGLTLQIVCGRNRYQHTYDSPEQCATDITVAESGDSDIVSWEGNESEDWVEPSYDDIRNGGYKVFSLSEIRDIDADACGWQNVCSLAGLI